MKKLFSELTNEELVKVFNCNEKLRNSVYDDFIEGEMFWIGEQIDYIKNGLSDWHIGAYNHNYLKISDYRAFLDGVEKIEEDFGLLDDEGKYYLEKAINVSDAWYESEMYSDEYYELENEMKCSSNLVTTNIIKRWEDSLHATEEVLQDYFVEFYSMERMDSEDYYIDTDSYELFEQVNYVKSYR